ncbi:MAG TPA: helix-turn-helix domain-containing protein [Streptomyces sp.]|nr:helix-turn-helix domain-containing protein [Streptomyces sp.]
MTPSRLPPLPPPGERRRLREAADLTRTQLAARLGVPRETVRAWETSRRKPRGRRREAYAELLTALAATEAEPRVEPQGETRVETRTVVGAAPTAPPPPPAGSLPPTGPLPREPLAGGLVPPEALAPGLAYATPVPDGPRPLTPAQAFDALYASCVPALVRQAYLLTGRRALAREAVERAFRMAWERWPEVARDPDPAGWVRAAAYECALSPWHRFRRRHRRREPPPADPRDRALLDMLLALPPRHRRTLVLYDGVGLDLPETAAETEASTPAAAGRLVRARESVAARLPDLSDPEVLHRRLAGLASAEQARPRAAEPPRVRWASESRARWRTRAAVAFTAVLIGTTALALRSAPTRYEAPPVPPAPPPRATVGGIPPPIAPGPQPDRDPKLRRKPPGRGAGGPERLEPLPD